MKQKPNIILIMTDQFRGDCIGADGNPHIYTPFLDSLADRGVLFRRGYSPSPTCIPARACMVTGQYPANAGFFTNNFQQQWDFPDTLMYQLRDNGYQTINVGKNHFKPVRSGLGFEEDSSALLSEPVFTYTAALPPSTDISYALSAFKKLESEETKLSVSFN